MIIITTINIIFQVYTLMLFARILMSWLPELHGYRIMRIVCWYTDPYLNFFRRFIPPLGMIDISPILAFLCLGVLQNIVVNVFSRMI